MALLAFTLFFDSLDDFGRREAFCWPRCVGCIPECERQEFTAPLQDNPSIPAKSFGAVDQRKAFSFPRSVLHEE
eukprot:scaffold5763_cov23-Cyclotella_meneghiniana.AAC.1